MHYKIENLLKDVSYKAVRSRGKGGQNVNKVSTKVELYFDISASLVLSPEQKEIIAKKLVSKISDKNILKLTCDTERSQFANKQLVAKKFIALIKKALTPKKKRFASQPSKESKEKRLKLKKELSAIKQTRKKPMND